MARREADHSARRPAAALRRIEPFMIGTEILDPLNDAPSRRDEAGFVVDHLLARHLGHGRYFVGPLRDSGGFAGIKEIAANKPSDIAIMMNNSPYHSWGCSGLLRKSTMRPLRTQIVTGSSPGSIWRSAAPASNLRRLAASGEMEKKAATMRRGAVAAGEERRGAKPGKKRNVVCRFGVTLAQSAVCKDGQGGESGYRGSFAPRSCRGPVRQDMTVEASGEHADF
jgi:hypothetical protein